MKKIPRKEGMKMLPLVWTMALSQKDDFFIEPFSLTKTRFRCFFEKTDGITERLTVYFHLSETEEPKDFPPLPSRIYFYGAYNPVSVRQVRSFGNIRELEPEEKAKLIRVLKDRLDGKDVGDNLPLPPSPEKKEEARQLIKTGKFYCFEPLYYEYNIYERD